MRAILLSLAVIACNRLPSADQTKAAKIGVKKLAYEGYPQWASVNPAKQCPDSIDELVKLTGPDTANDPWGHPYTMKCGTSAPPDAHGMLVVSAGPDGKPGTADDIASNQD